MTGAELIAAAVYFGLTIGVIEEIVIPVMTAIGL